MPDHPGILVSPDKLTIRSAANYTGLSTDTIRARIRNGLLKAHRTGPYRSSRIVIDRADLDAMLTPVPTVDATPTPDGGLPVTLASLRAAIAAQDARIKALETALGQAVA